MTNPPWKVGDRYLSFVVEKPDRGWGGPYGQTYRHLVWRCIECGATVRDTSPFSLAQMAHHHECGHAPCDRCGQMLLRRKDGSPRQHAHNRCPGKNPGHKIELEFIQNMERREYA